MVWFETCVKLFFSVVWKYEEKFECFTVGCLKARKASSWILTFADFNEGTVRDKIRLHGFSP